LKQQLKFYFFYWLLWIILFFVARALFIVYEYNYSLQNPFDELLLTFLYGARLDLSTTAYLSFFPFILYLFSFFGKHIIYAKILNFYTYVTLFILILIIVIDVETFRIWGFRLDASPLRFLSKPSEMTASITIGQYIKFLLLLLLSLFLFIKIYLRYVFSHFTKQKFNYQAVIVFVVFMSLNVIFLRGGTQQIPINQSNAFFSQLPYINQVTLNVNWHFFKSLVEDREYSQTNRFNYFSKQEAQYIATQQYSRKDTSFLPLLTTTRPNILLIVWESLTAKVVAPLGGRTDVTPFFTKLCKEGILFSQIYANESRSDKGLTAILSGYPAQSRVSIMTQPRKNKSLPMLPTDLSKVGYKNYFYYGGELNFANMFSYLSNGNFEKITGKYDFDRKDWNAKWGAHDHVVFNRILEETPDDATTFFKMVFTLSSHEPFDVPIQTKLQGNTEESWLLNAHFYTDQSLGKFIESAKQKSWWKNTLVVIIADHGHRLPELQETPYSFDKTQFHIPMLWLGGAVAKKDTVINALGSQSDVAYTLLQQLHIHTNQYIWSRNITSTQPPAFVHYVYNDGFGLITNTGEHIVFDIPSQAIVRNTAANADSLLIISKAIIQATYQDYLER
jgi:phosphoglycerol transferase MdoB-like AlkP superfamily enzyme